jgi:hypothetical protein
LRGESAEKLVGCSSCSENGTAEAGGWKEKIRKSLEEQMQVEEVGWSFE